MKKRIVKIVKKYFCKDCPKQIHRDTALHGGGRCHSCATKNTIKLGTFNSVKGKNNPNYKDGRTLKKHFCKCGNEISRVTARHNGKCSICAGKRRKGKDNHGKWTREQIIKHSKIVKKAMQKVDMKAVCAKRNFKGVNNPNYRGGINPLNKQIRNSFQYRQWRSDVFTRDDFTCQDCGKHGGNLEAHHTPKSFAEIIKEYNIKTLQDALNCEELWSINNGRTLCEKCHNKTKRGAIT